MIAIKSLIQPMVATLRNMSMNEFKLAAPVVLLIFNRPQQTQSVFDRIREAQPENLFIVADGPRSDRPDESAKCQAARTITENIDWDCTVRRNYSDQNLGCKKRVSSGLEWVFDQCPEAIILEDDCLPHPSFFRYCAELLEKYREDERVASISGDNFQFGRRWTPESYYFSRHPHVWGWASWRRVWRHYDVEMKSWPEARDRGWLYDYFRDRKMAQYWTETFESVYRGKIDTWDHQWTYNCWRLGGLAALPEVNLISNIGFGKDATHTRRQSKFSALDTGALEFPLRHPASVSRHAEADQYTERQNYKMDFISRARRTVRKWLMN